MTFEIIAKTEKGKKALEKIKDHKAKGGRLELIKKEPLTLRLVYPSMLNKLIKGREALIMPSIKEYVFSELAKDGISSEDIEVVNR